MNVLHFRNCRGITTLTGPETFFLNLLKPGGFKSVNNLLVVTIDPFNQSVLFMEELKKLHIPFEAIPVPSKFSFKDFWAIKRMIKDYHIDLLHTHDARSDTLGYFLSQVTHLPWITFAHGWLNWNSSFSKNRLYAFLEQKAVSLSPWILVGSLDMKRNLLAMKVPDRKIHYIPFGIDLEKFSPRNEYADKVREEFNIPPDCFLVGAVGRIHPWKGHRYLVEAAEIITKNEPQVRFLIVGDAAFEGHRSFQTELTRLVNKLNLQDKIIFTGSRKDIPAIMNALDLFVLPSLKEPFGLVFLEAQACGKPVIATKVGGIPEAVKDGETGILVKAGDGEALATAIIRLMSDPATRQRMGVAGRKRVEENFSVQNMVRRTEELYEMILEGPQ